MCKSNIVSGCLFVVLTGVLLWQAFGDSNAAKENLYEDFGAWVDNTFFADREIEAKRLGINRFVRHALNVESAFIDDRVTLEEAVTQILAAAREDFPILIDWLAQTEQGDTPQERAARRIARHIEEDADLSQNQELRARLRAQLAELLRKYRKLPMPMIGAWAV